MSTSSIFLVTYNDGDYYTRYGETLGAFASRVEASDFALAYIAAEAEVYSDFREGVSIVEMIGDETVSTLNIDVNTGVDRESSFSDPTIDDLAAFYRGLERVLYA